MAQTNQTLAEGLDVFRAVVCQYRPMPLGRLGELTGFKEPKLRRILNTLESRGLVAQRDGGWVMADDHVATVASYGADVAARLAEFRQRLELIEVAKGAAFGKTRQARKSEGPSQQ